MESFDEVRRIGHVVFVNLGSFTPDDVGAKKSTSPNLVPRARQNVILELGYFIGKLGRGRVCALYRNDLELPSDYQGVVYVEMDDAGAWKTRLAQELVRCKLSIQLEALLGGEAVQPGVEPDGPSARGLTPRRWTDER